MAPYARNASRHYHHHRRWSDLPPEILDFILLCLSFPDCFSFGGVCSSWRSALLASKLCCPSRPPPLMVFLFGKDSTSSGHLMGLNGSQSLKLSSPRPTFLPLDFIVGSSFGWLVIASDRMSGLHLQSPLSDQRIMLPSTTSNGGRIWHNRRVTTCFTVVLSSPPISSGGCILVAQGSFMYTDCLAYFRLGRDREWTAFTEPRIKGWNHMAFHDGELIVTVFDPDDGYGVLIFNFDPHPNLRAVCMASMLIIKGTLDRFRLVSSGGELLLVVLHENPKVFKIGAGRWEVVESLGDRVLLLGRNSAESFCTRGLMGTGFKPNCIYYLTDYCLTKFSMADRSTETITIPLYAHRTLGNYLGFEWFATHV